MQSNVIQVIYDDMKEFKNRINVLRNDMLDAIESILQERGNEHSGSVDIYGYTYYYKSISIDYWINEKRLIIISNNGLEYSVYNIEGIYEIFTNLSFE